MPDLDTVPVDRVVANLERMIAEDPKNVEFRVNLARLHSMAYAHKIAEVKTLRQGRPYVPGWGPGQPYFATDAPYRQLEVKPTADAAAGAKAREHLTRAITAYRAVLAMAPRHGVAQLGFGWTLKESGDTAAAIIELRRAVELGWAGDASRTVATDARSMTEEAAYYLRGLLDPVKDAAEIATLDERVRAIRNRPRVISPIAVPLRTGMSAGDMIAADRLVTFDLDGSGIARKWTWLSDDAAWLVHDHRGTGQVTSALQLFGNVTFWAFWDNGYHALRAMDDDGDSEIRGQERVGLAVWHDRNCNGISERGEVRPLIDWGIVSLSTTYEYDAQHQHEIAWSPNGVVFASGEVRPTYDLVMSTLRTQ